MCVGRLYYLWAPFQDSKRALQSICYKKRVLSLVGPRIEIFWTQPCAQVNHGIFFCLHTNPVCECTGCHINEKVVPIYKKKKSPQSKYRANYSALQPKENYWRGPAWFYPLVLWFWSLLSLIHASPSLRHTGHYSLGTKPCYSHLGHSCISSICLRCVLLLLTDVTTSGISTILPGTDKQKGKSVFMVSWNETALLSYFSKMSC